MHRRQSCGKVGTRFDDLLEGWMTSQSALEALGVSDYDPRPVLTCRLLRKVLIDERQHTWKVLAKAVRLILLFKALDVDPTAALA
jgi:hypothetical protein